MIVLIDLWDHVLKEPILTIISGVFSVYAAIIAHKIATWLNIKNEEELRDVLHKSADNAVDFATTSMGNTAKQAIVNGTVDVVVGKAMEYVKSKNKGTLNKLKVSDKALADIITAKVGKKV